MRAGEVDGAGRSALATSSVVMSSFTQKSAPESGSTVGPSLSTSSVGGPSPIDCGNCGESWNGTFCHGAWLSAHGTLWCKLNQPTVSAPSPLWLMTDPDRK